METITPEYARLRAAITERRPRRARRHGHGVPETEYDPEMEVFAAPSTLEVVATVWH